MDCDFLGIKYKLVRAHESIRNLDREITRFLKSGKYSVFSYEDKQAVSEAIKYHESRVIPLRFSVIAGEIVHHLRSSLDHIVWQFSSDSYKRSHKGKIEFPIFETRPTEPKRISTFNRKIEGISNIGALMLIERLQPYNAAYPVDSPLLIIHKMDIVDKHQVLILCGSTAAIPIPMNLFERQLRYQRGEPGVLPVDFGAEFKRDPKIYAEVAFKQFGGRTSEPVIQGLGELYNFVFEVVGIFEGLSRFKEPTVY